MIARVTLPALLMILSASFIHGQGDHPACAATAFGPSCGASSTNSATTSSGPKVTLPNLNKQVITDQQANQALQDLVNAVVRKSDDSASGSGGALSVDDLDFSLPDDSGPASTDTVTVPDDSDLTTEPPAPGSNVTPPPTVISVMDQLLDSSDSSTLSSSSTSSLLDALLGPSLNGNSPGSALSNLLGPPASNQTKSTPWVPMYWSFAIGGGLHPERVWGACLDTANDTRGDGCARGRCEAMGSDGGSGCNSGGMCPANVPGKGLWAAMAMGITKPAGFDEDFGGYNWATACSMPTQAEAIVFALGTCNGDCAVVWTGVADLSKVLN